MSKVTVWLAFIALVGVADLAMAAGPVNPKTVSWIAPTTNTDGTPLKDLASYKVYIATGPAQPAYPGPAWTMLATVPSTTLAPIGNTPVIYTLPVMVDGQKYVLVTAVDTTSNESAASVAVPFEVNNLAPSAPSGLQVQ